MFDIYDTVATSNPTTTRLLNTLLADSDELLTEPTMSNNDTIDVQIRLALMKVIEMVLTPIYIVCARILCVCLTTVYVRISEC